MSESFVPSLREYAANFQIDSRRLSPRQLLMHPGPVNRGVELSGEAIDSPQSLIAEQVAAGPGGADGDPLRAARRPRPQRARRRAEGERLRPADPDRAAGVSAGGTVLTDALDVPAPARTRRPGPARGDRPRPGRRDRRRPRCRRPRRPHRRAGGARRGRRRAAPRSSTPRACTPSPPSSTPTSTCAPRATSTRRTSRPAPAPPPPAATAGSWRWPTPSRRSRPPADVTALREQARDGASVPVGFLATVTAGMRGEELTEMVELREAGAIGFTDDGLPISQRPGHAPRAPVPAPLRRHDRPSRGGPRALRRRCHARGPGLGRARPRRHPLGLGVDDDRPRRRARRLRGRPDPRPAPLRGRVGRRRPRRQGAPG